MNDHTDTSVADRLRAATDQISLDDATRERLREQLLRRESTATKPARRRRRMPRIAFGAALAGAAALVLLVALSPFDMSSSPDRRSASSPAQLALLQAADAAAAQAWRPLTGDTYFHVYTTSYVAHVELDPNAPKMRPNPRAEPISIEHWNESGGGFSGVGASESWFRSGGSGLSLFIDGGDPTGKHKPIYSRDPRTGKVRGMGGMQLPADTEVDASLAVARSIIVGARPADGPSWQRQWGRVGDGYELTHDQADAPSVHDTQSLWSDPAVQAWGLTAVQLQELNEGDGSIDSRIRRVIGDQVDSGLAIESFRVPTGQFGRTVASIETEAGIAIVLGWLGRAPLSPDARRGLFEWIAAQPGAKIENGVRDELGRTGTRVTFETKFDEQVDATTIDRDELVRRAKKAGFEEADTIQTSKSWKVPSHREYRRWISSFIIDEATGELLESHGGSIQFASGRDTLLPEVYRYPDKLVVQTLSGESTLGSGGGGTLYRARERVQSIEPKSPICQSTPKVCEPGTPID